ncbi:MAG: hypothetical protein MMC33_005199 [Icmadophila ericetorum]|nr:hypothetical protein [Icmadophila ericetorum]
MYSSHLHVIILFAIILATASTQQLASDPSVYGPPIELVHIYNDEFPTGIAVSSTGRKFSNYPPSLDANNTNYQVAELISYDTEVAYPNVTYNSPPGGFINYTSNPPSGANYPNYLISVSSVVIDGKDRLWILDNGRALTPTGTLVLASYGGPKLIGIDLTTNTIFQTIIFSTTVAYPDSNLNDVRFDLRPNTSSSTGHGTAYITDSSTEGRNGLIVVDLGTGTAWRHLDNTAVVRGQTQFFPIIWGEVIYSITAGGGRLNYGSTASGSDGITLSADGDTLFWTAVGNTYLYSIPTARLRDNTEFSEILAQASVVSHGQKGTSDGLEVDSNGLVYAGNFGQNAIEVFNPANGSVNIFVRDPRIGWTDSMSVGTDGFLYFTENQLWRTAIHYPGVDRRVRPFALFRVKVPGGGTKALLV